MKPARLPLLPRCREHRLCRGFLASSSSEFPISLPGADWLRHPKTPGRDVPQPPEKDALSSLAGHQHLGGPTLRLSPPITRVPGSGGGWDLQPVKMPNALTTPPPPHLLAYQREEIEK